MVHTKDLLDIRPSEEGDARHVRFPGELSESVSMLDFKNDRLKLFSVQAGNMDTPEGEALIKSFDGDTPFTKLVVYSHNDSDAWKKLGFDYEGVINGYFRDGSEAHLWARYSEDARSEEDDMSDLDEIVKLASAKDVEEPTIPQEISTRMATEADADRLAALLNHTFDEYPKELTGESIRKMILSLRAVYRVATTGDGSIVACAAVELDLGNRNGEVTECATHEDYQGKGLMAYLIRELERDIKNRFGITDLYSTARAHEVGMNMVLAKLGYTYTGRQINNCRMPRGWESMNIWCRSTA